MTSTGRKIIGAKSTSTNETGVTSKAAEIRKMAAESTVDPNGYQAKGEGTEMSVMCTLTEAAEALEVDEDGQSVNDVIWVDQETKAFFVNLKRYINTRATKSGMAIGIAGARKIHDGLIKIFEDQAIGPFNSTKVEEDKIPIGETPDDPLEKVLKGIGGMNETVERCTAARPGSASLDTASSPMRKRTKRGTPGKKPPGGRPATTTTSGVAAAEAARKKRIDDVKRTLAMSDGSGYGDDDDG